MSILLLHLSDLHLGRGENPVLQRIPEIVGAVQAELMGCDAIALLVTGDIIDRGSTEKFAAATDFFIALEVALSGLKDQITVVSAFVPGNHDLKLTPEDQGRTQIVHAIQQKPSLLETADETLLRPCLSAQDEFFDFLSQRTGKTFAKSREKLYYEVTWHLCQTDIRVRCINSSWLSTVDEKRGSLLCYLPAPEAVNANRLTITLLHHPYPWLQTENHRHVRQEIEHTSDIILAGHEHVADAYSKRTIRSERNEYIEGGMLQEDSRGPETGFNILVVDPSVGRVRTSIYSWNQTFYSLAHNGKWVSLDRSLSRQTLPFRNTANFLRELKDPGANFYHPAKENLEIIDFFVYPDCKDRSYTTQSRDDSAIDIQGVDVLAKVIENKEVLFSGNEKSGRTALLRKLYTDLQAESVLPIIISLASLRNFKPEKLDTVIRSKIIDQYGDKDLEKVLQFPKNRRAVLFDDLHLVNLNREGVNALIREVREFAEIVVFTASSVYSLRDFFEDTKDKPSLMQFKHFQIQRFGRLLRKRLVRRWLEIGREHTIQGHELSMRCREIEKLLDTLLRKNIVPSSPFYILTLIQASEANQTLSTETGSFGYHYEFLIVGAIGLAIKTVMGNDRNITQDMVHTFLSNLAYQSFDQRIQGFSSDQIHESIQRYKQIYMLNFSSDKFQEILHVARMLRTTPSGESVYSYPYIYYFFVAKYFQRNLGSLKWESILRNHLERISSRLHLDENAHIILFFIYLSKDERTIDMILARAKGLFAATDVCNLDSDVRWMSSNFDISRELQLADSKPDENRDRILAQLDKSGADETSDDRSPLTEDDEEQTSTDQVREILIALRHIHIVGQVIRSFPGTLEGEVKDSIAKECAMLGFRTTGFVLRAIERDKRDFTDGVIQMFRREGIPASQEQIQVSVDDFLTFVGIMQVHACLSVVSTAIGSQHLARTYETMNDDRANVPFELLKLKLHLDHQRSFPAEEIVRRYAVYSGKRSLPVAASVLRLMVWEHVYLFPIDPHDLDKVAKKLNLSAAKRQALLPREGGR